MNRLGTLAIVVIGILVTGPAFASWQGDFTHDGLSSSAGALAIYHDGLVIGGWFATASGNEVNGIARWDGSRWVSLDGGMQGSPPRVIALTEYDGNLIAGGGFTVAGSVAANNIAQWNGQIWAPLGAGIDGIVNAVTVFEGDLVVGGLFSSAGGVPVENIARWDGASWSALGIGRPEQVLSLAVLGQTLYAGSFYDWENPEPANSIGAWDGSSWHDVGDGLPYSVMALSRYAEPWWDHERLVAGGFHDYLSLWNGSSWVDYGDRLQGTTFGTFELILAMARDGTDLYVAGHFIDAGDSTCNHIARWDGKEYRPLSTGLYLGSGPQDDAFGSCLLSHKGNLYVGGTFSTTGNIRSACVGKWDPAITAVKPALALRAFPVPANPEVSLRYRLEQPSRVQLRIFDLRGLHVATAQSDFVAAGEHTASWNGQDDADRPLPSGIYVAVLEAGDRREATRVVLAR